MPWTLVQSAGASSGNGTSVSATFPSAVSAGNKLIAAVSISGGIYEDSSTPAAATGHTNLGTLSVTSNSFSPPSQALLVVMVAIGHGPSNTPSVTLTDSGNHTWNTGPVISATDSWSAIYWTYLSSAPGSISVTAKDNNSIGQSMLLDVRVVNGASSSQSGAASATNSGSSSTAWSGNITTTQTGSTVYCTATGGNTSATGSVNSGTTSLNSYASPGPSDQLTGRATSLTTTPGSTSLGWTGSASSPFSWAALEILPSISTNSVQDGIGNNWTQLGSVGNGTSQTSLWALDTPAADAGTTVTLTASFSTISTGSILIEEVSGLLLGSTSAMADGSPGTLTGTTQNPGSPTYSSSISNEYLVCAYGDAGNGTTVTAAAGWTLDGNSVNTNNNGNICIEYKNSTGGAETNGFTTSQASQWALVEVSFKTSALSGGVPYTGWTTFGPGLFTNPDSSYAGVQPWLGDPSITSQVAGSPSFAAGTGVFAGMKAGVGDPAGIIGGAAVMAPTVIPTVVNQWSNSYGQGTTFASITSAFQSCVVTLNKTNSVTTGSGFPTAGNWLFVIASWTQTPQVSTVHVGVYDDIHSWWRQFPASAVTGNVRTSISYTPNLARSPSYIYVAPDMAIAAITVTVIEVSGLGPWDTVAGMSTNYQRAATTLSLTLPSLPSLSFILAGVGGDSTGAGQAFTPSGYTPLRPVAQANGSNQSASNYLTSAYVASSNGAQVATATASIATDMAGFIIAVYTTGNSPIPAFQNPNWPLMIFEAGFGSGFNTPDSEIVWTDISNRLWDWEETTGVQFQLGQIQSTNLIMELDNNDAFLSPSNTSSPYYPNLQPGTPLRLRAALGTIGGSTINRWYIIQRNAGAWDEQIADVFRRYIPLNGTDLWASLSTTPPTFYRSEIYEDNPGWWWPMDDQPGTSQVLPTVLHNIAIGNANPLNIVPSPTGVTGQPQYDTTGTLSTITTEPSGSPQLPPGILVFPTPLGASCAVYAVGASAGWMFGDPQSEAPTLATGNSVSAVPGSAAWQVTGAAGLQGKNGWFLSINDRTFPPISGGITVEGWFNYAFLGSQSGYFGGPFSPIPGVTGPSSYVWATQPIGPLTLMELTTDSNPVAILQLDTSGHLNLLAYNGNTPTNHLIYSASDLRANTWFMVTMTLTTTTWNVQINGGQTANVSGTGANFTSNWTWLILNGDMGNNAGSAIGTGLQHGGNVQISHVAVYPAVLPYYRIMDHYWAAVTAFGLLPAPTGIQFATSLPNQQANFTQGQLSFTPDGKANGGGYGVVVSTVPVFPSTTTTITSGTFYTLSMVVTANVGGYTSGPSPWAVQSGVGQPFAGGASNPLAGGAYVGYAVMASWSGVAASFQVFTAPAVKAELNAATVVGNSDTFTSGYGSASASNRDVGVGPGQTLPGTGAPVPSGPSPIGDTVGQRIERLMRAGRVTSPKRTIDPASLLVQAPGLNGGGIQTGSAIQAVQQADSGLLYIDNNGNLVYWMRPHLAAQYTSPVWQIGPTVTAGRIPYYRQAKWITDPQRVWNAIQIVPFSPTGASLNLITPNNATAALTSQIQYGAQPLQIQSILQSQTEMQNQANWLLSNYGTARRRAEQIFINAAAYPAAWQLVMGINVGDIIQLEDWVIGGGGNVVTMRVSSIRRHFTFGSTADSDVDPQAVVELMVDYEPTSYWT